MTSQQMKYIIALAEEKNFSKAAQRLYITQPALSQFVKNLEKEAGMPLFDRGITPLQLTSAGQIYLETAKNICMLERELERRIADLSDMMSGHFTIGTSAFRASCLLPKSIREFKEQYPGIQLEIVTDHVSRLKQMLQSGDIDLCIEADEFDPMVFHAEELFQENYYLALPEDCRYHHENPADALSEEDIVMDSKKCYTAEAARMEEITDLPLIHMKKGSCFHHTFEQICSEMNVVPCGETEVNQIETAFHWVNEGLACAIIPDTLIRFGNFARHPVYYKIPVARVSRPIVIAMKKRRYVIRAMQEYIRVLRELIGYGTWSGVQ